MLSFIGGFLLMLFLAAAASPLWLFWLARKGSRLSPFTMLEDGTARVIARGDSFHWAIARLKGYEIVTPKNIQWYPGHELWEMAPQNPEAPQISSSWERLFGLYWVGIIFQKLHSYDFRWTTLTKKTSSDGTGQVNIPLQREERLDYIFVKDCQYFGKIEEAEASDKMPVDVSFLITLRVINPYKATYVAHRWLDLILFLVDQRGRQYIGTRTYDQLIQEEGDDENTGFSGGIRKLREAIRKEYGVEIVRADIWKVDPAGELAGDYRKASTAKYVAGTQADAIIVTANAKAYATEKEGQARAQAIRDQATAFSESKEAAQATLDAEVGRALSVEEIAKRVVRGVRAGLDANQQEQEGGTQ